MTQNLSEKQGFELCESVGKMLALELESDAVKSKVKRLVTEYVKKNKLNLDSAAISGRVHWHVQVMLEK